VSARARWVAALAMVVAVAACGDTKSGPNTPLSIQFNPPQLPSMLVNDQLHDTLGNIDSLHAIVFNSAGDTIPDAAVRYQHADTSTIVSIDAATGHVTASDTGFARVVAQTSGLQSPPETLFVVSRPDLFFSITHLNDTLDFTSVRTDTLFALSVGLSAAAIPVDHWRIEYRFVYPAGLNDQDSTRVLLSDDNRKFSLVDTTGVGISGVPGTATRFLRVSAFAHPFDDTVVVEARAFYPDHTVVPGSPLRFKVLVNIP
jgi:hypothetical protein